MNILQSNKRKREDGLAQYQKKPRFDNSAQWQPNSYFQNGSDNANWAYRQTQNVGFPPPVKPELGIEEDVENEEPLPAPKPIPIMEAIFAHSIFWHRKIGSVYPLIPQTHFATSHCSDIPDVFLPKPPTNKVAQEFCPNAHLFRQKFRPQPVKSSSGDSSTIKGSKKNKPAQFLHVFDECKPVERLEHICSKWRDKFSKPVNYPVEPEQSVAFSRNLNLWFGQFCLVCERELSHKSAGPHFRGKSHLRKYQLLPVKATYERVDPIFVPINQYSYREVTNEHKKPFPLFGRSAYNGRPHNFLHSLGFDAKSNDKRILVLGDFDMTFSIGLKKIAPKNNIFCAPFKFDAEDNRVQMNLKTCSEKKIEVLKDLKSFEPEGNFKFDEPFDKVFILFPRVSYLTNLADPLNSRFLQKVFRNVNKSSVIRPDGYLYILMKRREFIDWDISTIALQEKLYLQRASFHQNQALHPFQPRQPSGDAQSKAKRLNGIKAPLYYIFARTKEQGLGGVNPWVDDGEKKNQQPAEKKEAKAPTAPSAAAAPAVKTETEDADAVLQNLEIDMKTKPLN